MKEFKNDMVNGMEESEISYYLQEKTVTAARVFIDEDVISPRYYRPIVQHLLNTTEGDSIEFIINSGGGSLDGCYQLIEAIRLSSADVFCIITGAAHSAASMIAMSAHDVLVTDSAEMLIHCASYGSPRSKQSDIKSFVDFSTKQLDKLISTAYEGFLSEQEIKDVQNGKELWLCADEIRERFESRAEYFKLKQQETATVQDEVENTNEKSSRKLKNKSPKICIDKSETDAV
jgi:ATP-dependent protease ClpP protease subunit